MAFFCVKLPICLRSNGYLCSLCEYARGFFLSLLVGDGFFPSVSLPFVPLKMCCASLCPFLGDGMCVLGRMLNNAAVANRWASCCG